MTNFGNFTFLQIKFAAEEKKDAQMAVPYSNLVVSNPRKELMDKTTSYLQLAAAMATAIGVVLAVFQLYLNQKQTQRSRDLEISLNMIETFRVRWENSWRVVFRKIESEFSENEKIKEENLDDLLNMLNWAHWLGNLIGQKHLKNKQLIFDAVGPQLKDMLRVGRAKITDDIEKHGIKYWGGLVTIGKLLDINWVASLERQMLPKK